MKFGNIGYLLATTLLTPALFGVALSGCDDEDKMDVDGGRVPDGGGLTDGPVSTTDGGGDTNLPPPPACTTTDTPVNAEITVDTVWNCPSYLLKRIIYVRNNATLTIMPGTVILSDTGVKPAPGLIVTRGAKLIAKGNKEKPIVFSSGNAPGARTPGDFAGVALLGSARLNSGDKCVGGSGACAAPAAFWERFIEGLPNNELHTYGGNDDANSCGELSYVRIEFAGTVLSDNKELNGLTMAGCGSGTKVSYIQVHRGKDDGVEIFGGTANIDHILVTGDEDDGLDWDFGWRGNAQFIIIHKWNAAPKTGNPNAFEGDNHTGVEISAPVSAPKISNVTLLGTTGAWGMTLRSGTRATIRNVIQQDFSVMTLNVGYTLVPAIEWPTLLSIENSFFWNNGPYVDATFAAPLTSDDLGFDEKMALEDPARKNKFDVNPGLVMTEAAPNYTPTNAALNNPLAVPPAGMIDPTATYAGAVAPNMPSWTEGWTKFPVN